MVAKVRPEKNPLDRLERHDEPLFGKMKEALIPRTGNRDTMQEDTANRVSRAKRKEELYPGQKRPSTMKDLPVRFDAIGFGDTPESTDKRKMHKPATGALPTREASNWYSKIPRK